VTGQAEIGRCMFPPFAMVLPPTRYRGRHASVRAAAERAATARKGAYRLACDAWNKRMLAFKGPAQPSPTLGVR
jgi:hypothetical protein